MPSESPHRTQSPHPSTPLSPTCWLTPATLKLEAQLLASIGLSPSAYGHLLSPHPVAQMLNRSLENSKPTTNPLYKVQPQTTCWTNACWHSVGNASIAVGQPHRQSEAEACRGALGAPKLTEPDDSVLCSSQPNMTRLGMPSSATPGCCANGPKPCQLLGQQVPQRLTPTRSWNFAKLWAQVGCQLRMATSLKDIRELTQQSRLRGWFRCGPKVQPLSCLEARSACYPEREGSEVTVLPAPQGNASDSIGQTREASHGQTREMSLGLELARLRKAATVGWFHFGRVMELCHSSSVCTLSIEQVWIDHHLTQPLK